MSSARGAAQLRVEPFALHDCSLARSATGRTCTNLLELLDAVSTGTDATIEHHMMRCALKDLVGLSEFSNDLARWCWDAIGDDVLAEQLELIDPYQRPSIAFLRDEVTCILAERLWTLDRLTWCRPGLELHVFESRVVGYDTGERFSTPVALAEALPRLPSGALFYHVHEAHRRSPRRTDDFSDWLERYGADASLVARLRAIDFHFLNINQLRWAMEEIFRQYLPVSQMVMSNA
jgi:hypothetical protein